MKYKKIKIGIKQDQRASINEKILQVVKTGNAEHYGLSRQEIYNAYTGKGGCHDLNFKDFDSYYDYSNEKKLLEVGQFFTPDDICRLIVDLIKPDDDILIYDPCCGKGSFFNNLNNESRLYGNDIDKDVTSIAKYLFGDAHIESKDMRYYNPGLKFDLIIGNPPYGIRLEDNFSEYVFFMVCSELLKPCGMVAAIIPCSFPGDDFFNKKRASMITENFNVISQLKLEKDTFVESGVNNYDTKIIILQKKSSIIKNESFCSIFDKPEEFFLDGHLNESIFDRNKKIIEQIKDEFLKHKASLYIESKKELDSGFECKYKKLLYDISVNKKTKNKRNSCVQKYNLLLHQVKPENINWNSWKHIMMTEKKLLSYMGRIIKNQHDSKNKKKRLELIKKDHDIKIISSDLKKRRELMADNEIEYKIYKLIHDKEFGDIFFTNMSAAGVIINNIDKLIERKRKNYELQSIPIKEIVPNEKIINFLKNDFCFSKENEYECFRLTKKQIEDIARCCSKPFSILNWQMGSGKTPASYAWALYQLKYNFCRKVIIVSPAISIKMTWKSFLENNNQSYLEIENLKDIEKLHTDTSRFVIIRLSILSGTFRMSKKKDKNKKKFKIRTYKHIKKYLKRISYKAALIFDESDEITNNGTNRTKAIGVFKKLKRKLLATGTTTRNNISELWSQFELLYNNSYNMICRCEWIYEHDRKDKKITSHKNTKFLNKPFPAKYGHNLFKSCFCPSKPSVFGLDKLNQDIFNAINLSDLISKTIITRHFDEIAGRKYNIKTHFIEQSDDEMALYEKILNESREIISNYYACGNTRKDSIMNILRQIELLIKATSIPESFDEYKGVGHSTKYEFISRLIEKKEKSLVAIGCLTHETLDHYKVYLKRDFDRDIYICSGKLKFEKREKLIKDFQKSGNGILLSTQQSLKSSVNIPMCNNVIIESLAWNIPKVFQYCFRFIRFDSENMTDINFVTYRGAIDSNLLALLMAKEKINEFVKTLRFDDLDDIYKKYGVDPCLLDMIMIKKRDDNDRQVISWGNQQIKQ